MQGGWCSDKNILLELLAKIEALETPEVIWEDIVAFHNKLWEFNQLFSLVQVALHTQWGK